MTALGTKMTALERAGRAFEALGDAMQQATREMFERGPYCPAYSNLRCEWLLYRWTLLEWLEFGDEWAGEALAERRRAVRTAIRSWRRLRARGEIPKEFLR